MTSGIEGIRARAARSTRGLLHACVAVLYVLGSFAPLVHVAEETHAWCELHERVEHHDGHAHEAAGAHEHAGCAARDATAGGAVIHALPSEFEGDHEACPIADPGAPKSAFTVAELALAAFEDVFAASPWTWLRELGRDDVLAFAPKHSPPLSFA